MLTLILIISIVIIIIGTIMAKTCLGDLLVNGGALLALISIIFLILELTSCNFNIESKIDMYIQENAQIEEKVKNTVKAYMNYEEKIYKELVETSDLTTLILKYPELNSNELVKSEINVYIENSKLIKEMKEKKIDSKFARFLVYFGQ